MKRKRIIRIALILLLVAAIAAPIAYRQYNRSVANKALNGIRSSAYRNEKMKAFETIAPSPPVIMIGNSLTDWFNDSALGVDGLVNMGISGDMTSALLDRLSLATKLKPGKIFVEIGINDVVERVSNEEITENWRTIISRIKNESPETKIYFLSLMPVDLPSTVLRWANSVNNTVNGLNEELKSICKENGVTYIDMHSALEEDGKLKKEYSEDGVHFTRAGYSVWVKVLEPFMEE
ncbi:MAG: G-D-S-L family lipolytic protein [Bacteroidetes bacterium]|nr:MAG: G-D-S-L family lipolytic protein [Bacteroidota bacterium]